LGELVDYEAIVECLYTTVTTVFENIY